MYLTLVAHALAQFPEYREEIRSSGDESSTHFAQEIRRFYPFFPFLTAVVRRTFHSGGYVFPEGTRAMLDVYGTNHDPRAWRTPELFRPERFREGEADPFSFIPQGGADLETNHRCPGEQVTIELMKLALHIFTRHISYEVPPQDLNIQFSRTPALPGSRMILRHVRRLG